MLPVPGWRWRPEVSAQLASGFQAGEQGFDQGFGAVLRFAVAPQTGFGFAKEQPQVIKLFLHLLQLQLCQFRLFPGFLKLSCHC